MSEIEDWAENKLDEIWEGYEKAGTTLKGGKPIYDALLEAYKLGQGELTAAQEELEKCREERDRWFKYCDPSDMYPEDIPHWELRNNAMQQEEK